MAENECPHILKRGGSFVGSTIYGCALQPARSYREERNSCKCVFGQACQLRQEYAEAENARLRSAIGWQNATIAARDARITELKEALRPFAFLNVPLPSLYPDEQQITGLLAEFIYPVTVGDIRKARALLSVGGDEDDRVRSDLRRPPDDS